MQFEYLDVKQLFGLYDYRIDFFKENHLTIITGPNGYGKTTLLTILDSLSAQSLYYFYLLKFDRIEAGFNDGSCIIINQIYVKENLEDNVQGSDIQQEIVKEVRFRWLDKEEKEICQFLYNNNIINKAKRNIRYESNYRMRNSSSSSRELDRVLLKEKKFNELVARETGQDLFLMQLQGVQTKFIHANRIYRETDETSGDLPIQRIKKELQQQISEAYKNYLLQSQRIDNLFIKNVLSKEKNVVSEENYNTLVAEVTEAQDNLFRFKLTDKIDIPKYDKENSFILSNYVQGLKNKYSQYGNLTEKLNLFNKLLLSKKFANKDILFSPKHGFQIVSANGDLLDESLLSSGEQNEIVLLFMLIFEVPDNSVLLIDEPENSLHVAWQKNFLSDVREIANIKNLQVVVSTHSISIVTDGINNTHDLYYIHKKI